MTSWNWLLLRIWRLILMHLWRLKDAKFQEQIKQWVTVLNVKCCWRHFCTLKSSVKINAYCWNILCAISCQWAASVQKSLVRWNPIVHALPQLIQYVFFFMFYCVNCIHVQGRGITQPSLIVPTHFCMFVWCGVSVQMVRITTQMWKLE